MQLSNRGYDDVLDMEKPDGVELIAYADDLAIVVTDKKEKGIKKRRKHDQESGPMVKRKSDEINRSHSEKHIRRPAKTERTIAALRKITPNVGGPTQKKREALAHVVNSVIMYGAQIWNGAMRIKRHKQKIQTTQRKMALKIISGYRTVSAEGALVVAGQIPLHLMARERRERYEAEGDKKEAKREARRNTYERWQEDGEY
ncbi:hypothetical protein NQ317_013809 [Molorchus minor]|uniref:Reverse transcriptase domain-containing protein n=1 Tax=Molorchus minor TaxID=1323400 RepID=A0ABQ9IQJ6_9CUCU|nr:hypothetical protein NQ317_013809 [Molorchus minor]